MSKLNSKSIIAIIIIGFVTFAYGFSVGQYKIFPYENFKEIKQQVSSKPETPSLYTDKSIFETDPAKFIQIYSVQDALSKKNSLIEYIWKKPTPINNFPSAVDLDIFDQKLSQLSNADRIDKLTIEMEYGVNSIVYLILPETTNNELIVYHHGHGEDFRENIEVIEFFLKNNYTILAFSMPLSGMNSQPMVDLSDYGNIKLFNHNRLQFLESPDFSPIKYFVEPISTSLNYIDKNFDFNSYNFVGISGGGWTGVIYSAIDPRITNTFSVAGSLPMYLRTDPQNYGDYEQEHPELYSITNYLELYVLGGYGEDRRLIQIFNDNDPCCFSGDISFHYSDSVKNTIELLGPGFFEVIIAKNNYHTISENSLKQIHEYILPSNND